ncbi:MAG TPA: dihydrodipicolinate synthase family protein [Candidatus Limnocylindrales bacterium]|jgi:4-hydroxy-tetrahydrodipicolinate synthase
MEHAAKELYPLSGVVAIPQTPFDDDDRVDLDSFARGVADRLAAGVDGLLYPVVASEVSQLTDRERRTLTRAVLEQARGRVPVFVGASADDVATVRALAEFAATHGAAGVLVQAPVALLRDEAATVAWFRAVCEAPIDVLMIQDLEWGGPGLPVRTIARLFEELEPFRCIKVETVPAGPKYTAILAATGGRLTVAAGWAVPYLMEALARGIHVVTPGGLHWVIAEVIRRHRGGDAPGARTLFDRLLPILGWQNQHIDISNQFLKLLAVRQGIFANARVRRPDVPFDAIHRRIADDLIEAAVALHAEIGWHPA